MSVLKAQVSRWLLPSSVRAPPRKSKAFTVVSSGEHNKEQQRQQQPGAPTKPKNGKGILATVLDLSAAPYSAYVPEPRTFLHHASAEAKQLWMVAVLLVTAGASPPVRLAAVALLAAATVAALPRRLWEPQLRRVGGLCALLFVFTAIGSDGVAPVLADRSAPAAGAAGALSSAVASAAAGAAGAGAAAAVPQQLPSSMAGLASKYSYVLMKLGPITITRKGLNLAVALAGLTFTALQSASLCLVTTPPESMAAALGRALGALSFLGLPAKELVLMVLLALRFMGTVFEDCRNLCLGLASRGINWGRLGARETLGILLGMATKLFASLEARCDSIAVAMCARGFRGPQEHVLHLGGGGWGSGGGQRARARGWRGVAADAAVLGSLCALLALSYVMV